MPLVRGERETVRDAIFAEGTYHAAYEPQRAVRTPRWKYIRRFDDRDAPVAGQHRRQPEQGPLAARPAGPTQTVDAEQLYDLLFDPNEARNLAAEPAAQPVKDELRRQARALDAGDRGSAARRAGAAAARRRVQRPRPALARRADPHDEAGHHLTTSPGTTSAPSDRDRASYADAVPRSFWLDSADAPAPCAPLEGRRRRGPRRRRRWAQRPVGRDPGEGGRPGARRRAARGGRDRVRARRATAAGSSSPL